MKVTHIYQHPEETFEQRKARAQEMLAPIIDRILSNPQKYKAAIRYIKEDENGKYLEDPDGNRYPYEQ